MTVMYGKNRHGFGFSPVVIGLFGILAGAIVVAVCHCVALGCCYQRRRPNSLSTTSSQLQGRRSNQERRRRSSSTTSNAAQELTLTSNTVISVFEFDKERGNDGVCSVCLSEFIEGEQIRVLVECYHSFHKTCIDMWLHSHSNCPLCRTYTRSQSLPPPPPPPPPPPRVLLGLPDPGGEQPTQPQHPPSPRVLPVSNSIAEQPTPSPRPPNVVTSVPDPGEEQPSEIHGTRNFGSGNDLRRN